jgi:CxxC motif-containing protein (DUF1111 family)
LRFEPANNQRRAIVCVVKTRRSGYLELAVMRHRRIAGTIVAFGRPTYIGSVVVLLAICTLVLGADRSHRSRSLMDREEFEGRELFVKVWEPGKPSAAGGDGLGPLYNERSCVGCHHLGGTGGGGGNERNVILLTALAEPPKPDEGTRVFQGELEQLHPGFRNRQNVVIHHHAVSRDDESRLAAIRVYSAVQTRDEMVALRKSSRNTPALFGAGLIDGVPDAAILEAEKRRFAAFPEIKGRVSRLPGGRLGRFGWKGQTARLNDFVLAACSNELGLEVPGRHQVSLAAAKEFDPATLKLDLTAEETARLTAFVANLPPPVRPIRESTLPPWGYMVFERIGCATCHSPRLGRVNGLYSDLLLHDLGDRVLDFGAYGGSANPAGVKDLAERTAPARSSGEAGPTEWRTPPLWGVADSAPYLHDGRASTLDEAIRLHGGEAEATSERYRKLDGRDRRDLLSLLQSLTVSRTSHKVATRTRAAEKKKPKPSPPCRPGLIGFTGIL